MSVSHLFPTTHPNSTFLRHAKLRRAASTPGNVLTPAQFADLSHGSASSVALRVTTEDGSAAQVIWADGTTAQAASGTTITRSYGAATSGTVRIEASATITELTQFNGPWDFALSALPRGLLKLSCGAGALTGSLGQLPTTITSVLVTGANTIGGDISGLPPLVTYLQIDGANSVGGDIAALAGRVMSRFRLTGATTIFGDIQNMPAAVWFQAYGACALSGDVGNINAATTTFYVVGSSTLSGDLGNLKVGLLRFWNRGSNGTIAAKSSALPAGISTFGIDGAGGAVPVSMVDSIIADLAAGSVTGGGLYLDDSGLPAPTNSAGIATLQGRGWTVQVNA